MRVTRRPWRARIAGATVLALLTGLAVFTNATSPLGASTDCARRYVAGGDGVTNGKDADSPESERYSRQLLDDHLTQAPGPWCEYNTSQDPTTTDDFMHKVVWENLSQQAAAWERNPHLITLTLGRQNSTIVDSVDSCFDNIKDHDFLEANACALKVLASSSAWDTLRKDLAQILDSFRIQQDGNPDLIVAVTGYFNPYPSATSVATKIPGFCAELVDTIPTCIARWVLLPPALITLDQVVKKLNSTIADVVAEFTQTSQGRFVFVNPYDKFSGHCMEMKVQIKTKVYHPTNEVDEHDNSQPVNFGCDNTWIHSDGHDGTKSPFFYLTPAIDGVLLVATQTTTDMGINPNDKGHDCISDLIWESVKNKLGVPEAPKEACSDD